jgi:hypothetical protein
MLGSAECLRRAEELESRASKTKDAHIRAELLKVAEGWRDLAKRAREDPEGPETPDGETEAKPPGA